MLADHLVSALAAEFDQSELPGGIHVMTSLGIGPNVSVPDRPYIVYKELPSNEYQEVSDTSNVELYSFQIFVYDHKGDFTRINSYLRRIKNIIKSFAPLDDGEGVRCSSSVWDGMGPTIADDGYDSAVRYAIVRMTASEPA